MPSDIELAAEVFVVIIASIAIGVIGTVLLTTHEIRRTIKRGTREAARGRE
jgi:hypothetical protein